MVAGVLHARLLPAMVVAVVLSAVVRGLGACRLGGGGVSGSLADLAAARGKDSELGRLRAGSVMGWAREGGWTGGKVWRAGLLRGTCSRGQFKLLKDDLVFKKSDWS